MDRRRRQWNNWPLTCTREDRDHSTPERNDAHVRHQCGDRNLVARATSFLSAMYILGPAELFAQDVFDLKRHRGRMNILFVDGHVDSPTILSTGATSSGDPIGSAANSPSGALMSVSMDKDFR